MNMMDPEPQVAAMRSPERSGFFPNDAWRRPVDQLAKKSSRKKVSFEYDSDSESDASSTGNSRTPLKYNFKDGKEGVIAVPVKNHPGRNVEVLIEDFIRLHSSMTAQAQTNRRGPVFPQLRQDDVFPAPTAGIYAPTIQPAEANVYPSPSTGTKIQLTTAAGVPGSSPYTDPLSMLLLPTGRFSLG